MSYNTRRTGGGGRGISSTQVNYHHQQSRSSGPGGSGGQQSRNPGYSTSQPNNYSSSNQSGYSTQQGYSTAPPLPTGQPPKAPQSQPPPAPIQPPLPAQSQPQQTPQPQPQQKAVPVKMEQVTPMQEEATPESKSDATENGDGIQSKPFWKKKPFVKVSNKVRKQRQNAKLRRVLNPKNALTFLNELRPGGVKFMVREEPGWGYVASVDINGKVFSGHSLTVSKAKVQASEQALKHLLLEKFAKSDTTAAVPPENKDDDANKEQPMEECEDETEDKEGQPKAKRAKIQQEDELPWGSLAAFALHKLFAEWQKEGAEVGHGVTQEKYDEEMVEEAYFGRRPGPSEFGFPRRFPMGPFGGRGRGFGPRGPPPPGFGMPRRPPPAGGTFPSTTKPTLPLGGVPSVSILPMKKIPEDANKRHPVMLLNQLKPNVIYNESREGEPPVGVFFNITVILDGKEYVGKGKSKKEAKVNAAKAALLPLGIKYDEDNN